MWIYQLLTLLLVLFSSFCASSALKYSYYDDCTSKYEKSNASTTTGDADPTVLRSLNGKIKGYCSVVKVNQADDYNVKTVELFNWLGVPYAEPPVGALRFRHPVPVKSWDAAVTRDGTQWPNRCVQPSPPISSYLSDYSTIPLVSVPSSEDCLYLNIAVPAQAILERKKSLPIFVFIHGGGFLFGSSTEDIYEPSTLAATANMIVITVNYRLGPLGSLHLEDTDASGNQALMDQSLAFRWIHENAHRFGGDPNRITIGGESSGSIGVGYHLIYRGSWPYFRNAIMESGSPLFKSYPAVSSREASRRGKAVLEMAGCSNANNSTLISNQDLIDCARKASPDALFIPMLQFIDEKLAGSKLLTSITTVHNLPMVIDGKVFKEPFEVSMKTGRFKKCNILAGHNANEFGYSMAFSGLFGKDRQEWQTKNFVNASDFKEYIYQSFFYYPEYPQKPSAEFFKGLFSTYLPADNLMNTREKNYFHDFETILSEAIFVCPLTKFANFYAKAKRHVYYYSYEHRLSSTVFPPEYGVPHAEELAVVFGETLAIKKQPLLGFSTWTSTLHNYTSEERSFNLELIRYWSNFVKHDNPNGRCSCEEDEAAPEHVKWSPYVTRGSLRHRGSLEEPDSFAYLVLKANEIRMESDLDRVHNCMFWN